MLICSYVVDQCLVNGLVGCVQIFVYHSPTVPWVSDALMAYVVIASPKWFIREYHKFFTDKPCTWVPINMAKFQCEKYCCLVSTIPLKFWKAIYIYITIFKYQYWKGLGYCDCHYYFQAHQGSYGYGSCDIFQDHKKVIIFHTRWLHQRYHCWGIKDDWSD